MSKKTTVSARQKRYLEKMKNLNYKKIQVYISSDTYDKLVLMRDEHNTFSLIVENSINTAFKKWSKSIIKKDKYDF